MATLVGRRIRKSFDEVEFTGTVVSLDKGTGWYRVLYSNGDLEELSAAEIQPLLVTSDNTPPRLPAQKSSSIVFQFCDYKMKFRPSLKLE